MTFYDWKQKIRPRLNAISCSNGFSLIVQTPQCTKWLVTEMVTREIPFKIINHGGGVKTITTDVDVCPKCAGTGRC